MIIFIHEFGHYLAAIKVGVRVEKFYLGFDFWGMKLFKFDYKGTEYGIGVFPLGGYVKMAGQNDFGEVQSQGDPGDFTSKTVWERIQVLAAGVIFNFISAFFFMGGALMLGHKMMAPVVGEIKVGSPAWKSNLKEGDKIISFNKMPITSFDSLSTEVALSDVGVPSILEIKRDGQKLNLEVTPELNDMEFPYLGFSPILLTKIKSVISDSHAAKAGIQPNDIILRVNDKTLTDWSDLSPIVQQYGKKGESLKLELLRDGKPLVIEMKPETLYRGELGFKPKQGREIKAVRPNSLAQKLNIKAGSSLLTVNGQSLHDLSELKTEGLPDKFELVLATQDGEQKLLVEENWDKFSEGIHIGKSENSNVVEVAEVVKDSLAQKMGMLKDDQILAFQIGKSDWINEPSLEGLIYSIMGNKDQTIQLKVKRPNGQEILMSSKIGQRKEPYYLLGLEPQVKVIEGEFLKTTVLWPLHLLRMTYKSLIRMFAGKVSSKHISGPVGIAKMTYAMADSGLSNLFYFMAILSISIAFFNCLPIPVLDGGQLLFCLIEWVKGSPVSERFMLKFQYLGFALILALLVFATWNDINSKF